MVIGPRAAIQRFLEIPVGHFADIVERKYHLYLLGWLAYRDILPGTPIRLTEFCFEIVHVCTG
jgi:hypothetical protein